MRYDAKADAFGSWDFWCRRMALAAGAVRFATIEEMYFQEARGVIP